MFVSSSAHTALQTVLALREGGTRLGKRRRGREGEEKKRKKRGRKEERGEEEPDLGGWAELVMLS